MGKKLTITLEELPDELWNATWHFAGIASNRQFGFKIESTDVIKVDCRKLLNEQGYEYLQDILSNSITLHLINEVNAKRQNEQIVDGNH